MIDEEICKLRDKLNKSIIDEKDYNIIYQISIELDELITQYYSGKNKKGNVRAIINHPCSEDVLNTKNHVH